MKKIIVVIGGTKEGHDFLDALKVRLNVALIRVSEFKVFNAYVDSHPDRDGDIALFLVIGAAREEVRESSIATFNRINADERFAAVPVAYLGQDDDQSFMDRCLDAGVLHLALPMDDDRLVTELRDLVYR
ncbi:MAG TPA: hypothetical protein PKM65_05050 [Spirochaetota bacterium]|nr:hypothetical protein [Spirochaetota bacterium]HNT10281.1 hypothetical protein [Spirochaetota bacterium]HOS41540.1 hypothetical protein [Spirochaetota bacterium]HPU89938.1 hypothetical protein [Spirochaetota bacterium]